MLGLSAALSPGPNYCWSGGPSVAPEKRDGRSRRHPCFESLQICLLLRPHLFSCAALDPSWAKQLLSHEQLERCILPAFLLIHRSKGHFLSKGPGYPRLKVTKATKGLDHSIECWSRHPFLAPLGYNGSIARDPWTSRPQRPGTVPSLSHT